MLAVPKPIVERLAGLPTAVDSLSIGLQASLTGELAGLHGCKYEHYCTSSNIQELEQSDICVISLCADDESSCPHLGAAPQHLFFKHSDVLQQRERICKSDEKWRITAKSFENEHLFYRRLQDRPELCASMRLPTVFANHFTAGQRVPGDEFDVTCTLLLSYIPQDIFHQRHVMTIPEAEIVVKSLARFHAAFWHGPLGKGAAPEVAASSTTSDARTYSSHCSHAETSIPASKRDNTSAGPMNGGTGIGGWWRKILRPSVQFHKVPDIFFDLCQAFSEIGRRFDNDEIHRHIAFLSSIIHKISAYTGDATAFKTVLHGDPKTSNLFLRAVPNDVDDGDEVRFIDFQWSGPARSGVGDVIYFLVGGVEAAITREYDRLIDMYYTELSHLLGLAGYHYSCADYEMDCAMEFLDYFTTALPQLWKGLNPAICADNIHKFGWLTHESQECIIVWMIEKALSYLTFMSEKSHSFGSKPS